MDIIRLYNDNFIKCPECNKVSSFELWDERTRQGFNEEGDDRDIITMKTALKLCSNDHADWYYHTCPCCNAEVSTAELLYSINKEGE